MFQAGCGTLRRAQRSRYSLVRTHRCPHTLRPRYRVPLWHSLDPHGSHSRSRRNDIQVCRQHRLCTVYSSARRRCPPLCTHPGRRSSRHPGSLRHKCTILSTCCTGHVANIRPRLRSMDSWPAGSRSRRNWCRKDRFQATGCTGHGVSRRWFHCSGRNIETQRVIRLQWALQSAHPVAGTTGKGWRVLICELGP